MGAGREPTWPRLRRPRRDVRHLLSASFLRRGGFFPAGTISLTTYFHANGHELENIGGDYVLGSAHANRFSDGYFDQSAHVWTRDGALLASTHQIVYFKG